MTDNELRDRIVANPKVMVGKPVIRGTRLTVECILILLAHRMTIDEILAEYPGLERDDIFACLLFAQRTVANMLRSPMIVTSE